MVIIEKIFGQGSKTHMEDFFIIDEYFMGGIFGTICDGHGFNGGGWAANHATENMAEYFRQGMNAKLKTRESFVGAYEKISREIEAQYEFAGTTAVSFFLKDGRLHYANSGDSRLMIIGNRYYRELSENHRADNIKERRRIEEGGGCIQNNVIYGPNGEFHMTRSLGDKAFKEIGIIATPHTGSYRITEDDFMIIAGSDGLFDTLSKWKIVQMAREYKDPNIFLSAIKSYLHHLFGRADDNYCVITVSF